ncbi:MAG: hypothetical protein HN644_02620 [Rhodospirillales bacterium]|jgi:hypothetical protein|nr:hypothetical protein [Rhodospirillales bacterium]MBT4039236.1 hypothetical protein [Rhodospirillales bacterium]MBT4626936.1 hypothetical protein [Rhodospirillales bacterium]MBT5352472.1 hypothetical protein [Rhodospirillales bacterium]MBT5521087.1 hypothetical protein [Rhodospirillales bacterium]
MRVKSIMSVIGLSVALAACGAAESVSDWMFEASFSSRSIDCEERTARQLNGVDFATAAHIEMVVRNGEFSPMVVRMTKGRSYVFRLRNRDDDVHTFDAPEFFSAIAVAAVAVDNTILETVCPGPVVKLQGGQSFEMQFLAAQDGAYAFTDTANGIGVGGLLGTGAPGGVIWIEEVY